MLVWSVFCTPRSLSRDHGSRRGEGLGWLALVACAALMGCGPKAVVAPLATASVEPVVAPSFAAAHVSPACVASLDDQGNVLLSGVRTGLAVPAEEEPWGPTVTTWRFDDTHVLVALAMSWEVQGGAARDGRLWKFDCSAPAWSEPLLALEGADFGHGAQTRDGHTLYFTGPNGVASVNLETMEVTQLTEAPLLDEEQCWGGDGGPADDVVVGLSDDERELLVHRGGPCGYESDWEAQIMVLALEPELGGPVLPGDPRLRGRHPVSTVVVDAGGTLWLGDAGACDSPGAVDESTRGAVWRSDDGGESWVRVAVVDPNAEHLLDDNAIAQILVDATRPGHLVVRTALCANSAMAGGGSLFVTIDSGRTWRAVPMTDELLNEVSIDLGYGVDEAAIVDGVLEHLSVRAGALAWGTTNGGTTWQRLETWSAQPSDAKLVVLGSVLLQATSDGLLRVEAPTSGAPPRITKIFPR